ncbi:MAG: DUF1232 domain-containing protein [Pseudohongiellaceae bacterium]|nr:DUF1232 domain-containing protein [Pseudohongiellaceae bacterium]
MKYLHRLKEAAHRIKQDAITVYFVARDARTPIFVQILALAIAAYAISPIDLIPDFIPILGYLDDVILLPLGIALIIKLTPQPIVDGCREKAQKLATKPRSNIAAAIVLSIWFLCFASFGYWLFTD